MSTISKSISLNTALGPVDFRVSIKGNDVSSEHISLITYPIKPRLPSGMSVRNCNAVMFQIGKSVSPFILTYAAKLTSDIKGTPCTGQYLAAIEWEDSQSILVIGTEDEEALNNRMPWLGVNIVESYQPSILKMSVVPTTHSKETSFHFIIAENPIPEPKEASAWFAVERNHSEIMTYVKSEKLNYHGGYF